MPRAERNAIESALETLVPAPVVDVLSALGRFVYAAVFSRSIDPNSWTASLVPPLISLLLAYASLVIAYRTVRNTFSLALFGVKYGALIGALIAIYSWWSGDSDAARGLAGIVGGALGGAGGVAGGVGGRDANANAGGMLAGGADILHALGRLGQGGGAAALPLLGALLGQVQNQGGRNNNNNNNPRRSTRLRSQNTNRRRARPANSNAYPASDPDYLLDDEDDDDDDDLDPARGGGAGDDTAIKAIKQVLRWITHATDPEANARRAAAPPNPLFPQTGSRSSNSNSRRRRRRRSSSGLSDLD